MQSGRVFGITSLPLAIYTCYNCKTCETCEVFNLNKSVEYVNVRFMDFDRFR